MASMSGPESPAESLPRWLRPTVTLPCIVGGGFFLLGVVQLLGTWLPNGDWAVAELVIRHTSRMVPLSGPYSAQRGYNHPLPLVYAIQWLPYHLLGQRSSAGLATTLWWNGAWLAFLVWFMARLRVPWLGLAAAASVVIMATRTPSASLLMPWNPTLAVVPAVVLVFVAWRVALGSGRLLPLAAALAVWCIGAHLGFAPFVLPVVGLAGLGLAFTTVRTRGRPGLVALWRPLAAAMAVGLVLLSPMLVDAARNGRDSNPVHIVERGRLDESAARVPRSELAKVLRAELSIPPAWAITEPPYDFMLIERMPRLAWGLVFGAFATAAAARRRAWPEVVGMGLALAGLAGAILGLANIEAGAIQPWYLLPAHAASIAFFSFATWSAGRTLAVGVERAGATGRVRPVLAGQRRPTLAPTVMAISAVVVLALAARTLRTDLLTIDTDGPVAALTQAAVDALPPEAPVLLAGPIDFDGFYTAALALSLDRAGFEVRVPDAQLYLFTPTMGAPSDFDPIRLVVVLSQGPTPPPEPGATLVAESPIDTMLYANADRISLWQAAPPSAP